MHKRREQQLQWEQKAENEKKNNAHADNGFIGAKAAKMMKKTITTGSRLDSAIEKRQGLLREVENSELLPINLVSTHHSILLQLNAVSLAMGQAKPPLISNTINHSP